MTADLPVLKRVRFPSLEEWFWVDFPLLVGLIFVWGFLARGVSNRVAAATLAIAMVLIGSWLGRLSKKVAKDYGFRN